MKGSLNMNNLESIIKSRRSIRKFLPDPISESDIREIIESAVNAPSACNSQCWHFIAVQSAELKEKLAAACEDFIKDFYADADYEENVISNRISNMTFFKSAPLVIAVFLTHMEYHDSRITQYYVKKGYTQEQMIESLGSPDILTIGAAIQNMLLTIHEKGLGACWMNNPVAAEKNICRVLNVPQDYHLMALIPVGKPAYTPREKALKPMEEVLEIR
jgi:F420 biosynthesis protein FbiB-like protein